MAIGKEKEAPKRGAAREAGDVPMATLYVKIRGQGNIPADKADEAAALGQAFVEAVLAAGVALQADVVATPIDPVVEAPPPVEIPPPEADPARARR